MHQYEQSKGSWRGHFWKGELHCRYLPYCNTISSQNIETVLCSWKHTYQCYIHICTCTCLPVSQIWALMVFPSTWMLLVANSTPIVDLDSKLNSLRVNRERRLDLPTPESPINTTMSVWGCVSECVCKGVYEGVSECVCVWVCMREWVSVCVWWYEWVCVCEGVWVNAYEWSWYCIKKLMLATFK